MADQPKRSLSLPALQTTRPILKSNVNTPQPSRPVSPSVAETQALTKFETLFKILSGSTRVALNPSRYDEEFQRNAFRKLKEVSSAQFVNDALCEAMASAKLKQEDLTAKTAAPVPLHDYFEQIPHHNLAQDRSEREKIENSRKILKIQFPARFSSPENKQIAQFLKEFVIVLNESEIDETCAKNLFRTFFEGELLTAIETRLSILPLRQIIDDLAALVCPSESVFSLRFIFASWKPDPKTNVKTNAFNLQTLVLQAFPEVDNETREMLLKNKLNEFLPQTIKTQLLKLEEEASLIFPSGLPFDKYIKRIESIDPNLSLGRVRAAPAMALATFGEQEPSTSNPPPPPNIANTFANFTVPPPPLRITTDMLRAAPSFDRSKPTSFSRNGRLQPTAEINRFFLNRCIKCGLSSHDAQAPICPYHGQANSWDLCPVCRKGYHPRCLIKPTKN